MLYPLSYEGGGWTRGEPGRSSVYLARLLRAARPRWYNSLARARSPGATECSEDRLESGTVSQP